MADLQGRGAQAMDKKPWRETGFASVEAIYECLLHAGTPGNSPAGGHWEPVPFVTHEPDTQPSDKFFHSGYEGILCAKCHTPSIKGKNVEDITTCGRRTCGG